MKPDCGLCNRDKTLTDLLGEENVKDLLHSLFNPYGGEEEEGSVNLEELVETRMDEPGVDDIQFYMELYEEMLRYFDERFAEMWVQEFRGSVDFSRMEKYRNAKREAWKELLRMIEEGEINPDDISMRQMLKTFYREILEELKKEEYITTVSKSSLVKPLFTEKSEKLLGERILEETMALLRGQEFGLHQSLEYGHGHTPGSVLSEYDDVLHTYDMIDIQETCLRTAMSDPENMEIEYENICVRIPEKSVSRASVILIDCSDSMKGQKMIGAVEAALGLRELLMMEYRDDSLWIVAFNHTTEEVMPGDIANLKPYGTTDIGLALSRARKILMRTGEDRAVFLITDGEPTTSSHPRLNPIESALSEAGMLGREDIQLNIIMLDRHPRLRQLCVEMAKRNRFATVSFVNNPLNLREFIIKKYIMDKAR